MSIGIHDGIDAGVKALYGVAGDLFLSAAVFPEVFDMYTVMQRAEGSPGALGAGGANWLEGAQALQEARQNLAADCTSLTGEQWSGDDRDAFDRTVQQLGDQLDDAAGYAITVGSTLVTLCLPFSLFPPVCISCAGVMAVFAALFEAAAASVVGDLGVSESIYATGQEAAVTCLEVINTSVEIITALAEIAAGVFVVSDVAGIAALKQDGDASVGTDFTKAQVLGLQDIAIDKLVDKIGAGESVAHQAGLGTGLGDRFAQDLIKTGVDGEVKSQVDEPVRDLEDGKPLDALADQLPGNLGELINEGVDHRTHG